jgi:hypothetical protein
MSGDDWQSELVPLIFGLDAQQLFPFTNRLQLVGWILLATVPRWKDTQMIALIPSVMHAIMYAWVLVAILMSSEEAGFDFGTLEGIVTAFRDPNAVFLGWIHYLSFDLLVGRAISKDAIENKGISNITYYFVVVPCLFSTLMVGPVGFLIYLILSSVFFKTPNCSNTQQRYQQVVS